MVDTEKQLRAALSAIAYMNLGHLPLEQQVAIMKTWAITALRGEQGTRTVIQTDAFKRQWASITHTDNQ